MRKRAKTSSVLKEDSEIFILLKAFSGNKSKELAFPVNNFEVPLKFGNYLGEIVERATEYYSKRLKEKKEYILAEILYSIRDEAVKNYSQEVKSRFY